MTISLAGGGAESRWEKTTSGGRREGFRMDSEAGRILAGKQIGGGGGFQGNVKLEQVTLLWRAAHF